MKSGAYSVVSKALDQPRRPSRLGESDLNKSLKSPANKKDPKEESKVKSVKRSHEESENELMDIADQEESKARLSPRRATDGRLGSKRQDGNHTKNAASKQQSRELPANLLGPSTPN